MTESSLVPVTTWSADTLPGDPSLSLFQKTLLLTDGTLTDLLALYIGQRLAARRIEQFLAPATGADAPVGSPGQKLLHRAIVLCTPAGQACLYAHSRFVFERFPEAVQRGLLETDVPIGRLWREQKLEMYREVVDRRCECDAAAAAALQVAPDTPLLSRTYLIYHQRQVLGAITEKFVATAIR